jgi:hypothetical protein
MSRVILRAPVIGVALLCSGSLAHSQDGRPRGLVDHTLPSPTAQAARRNGPVVIDARLDEPAWQAAPPVTEFTQTDPNEGKPATQRTEVRFLFDEAALYVGAKMYDSLGGAGVRTRLVRRDANFDSDWFQIVIDGYHDHLGRAFFIVNPSGAKQDQIGVGNSCCDGSWDPIWEAATHIDPDGWTAEIRIPLSQLRFSRDSVQTWGLQIRRFIQRNNEEDDWSFWRKNENGGPSRFGHLVGLRLAAAPKHLELLPYTVARERNVQSAAGDPFNSGNRADARAGLDLKYLLTSNLTLDATFNPDFGQVEVDPANVNLSAFETFYEEKRPFFIEGAGVFDFGGFNCYFCSNVQSLDAFYSRRIGRAPSGASLAYNAGKYADVPDNSTILGAGKVTGRTSNGFTVGLMEAVTRRETARIAFDDGTRARQEVEPLANYFVGRIKRDYLGGNLVVGAVGTSVIRHLDATFDTMLTRHAELLGSDVLFTWAERTYSLQGNVALSSINADSIVIRAKQRASARYYQRPDRGAGLTGFFASGNDPSATSMRGGGAYMRVAKEAGDWRWETALNTRTPGFETNDYSFLTRADYFFANANVFRFWSKPTSWYRTLVFIAGGQRQQNYDGDVNDKQAQVFLSGTTPQFWNWRGFYLVRPPLMDDRLLRGGPVVQRPATWVTSGSVSTDSRHRLVLDGGGEYSRSAFGGWGLNYNVQARYRPASNVSVSLGPAWNDDRSNLQYVTAVADPTATTFAGTRYVLAGLRQKQLSMDTRLNVTFTPNMTLELYAQPFLASAHYDQFKEFNAPHAGSWSVYGRDRGTVTSIKGSAGLDSLFTIDPDGAGAAVPFTIDNPDFNYRSLRGNAVFRWEYRPGSTLYVVWTQMRSNQVLNGDFQFGRDRTALFGAAPDNILLVKASWWIPR